MDRRNFVKSSLLGGGVLAFTTLESCLPPEEKKNTGLTLIPSFDLDEATVDQLRKYMEDGTMTSEVITLKYLKRIDDLDRKGPQLHSIIETNPDAVEIAKNLDAERRQGKIRGPLHGIPVIIKDNIDTADKMQTTAGSMALSGFHAPKDSFIVNKLREAGAIILAKANLSEWANIRSKRSSSGWSARGGQALNPYDITRSPCGSSSGSAISVAANFTALAIGTETDGSIVCPSGINGIVGIKPTLGLWSRHGIIPISHSQDTAGPMARTVKDAALLLGILSAKDEYDPATGKAPESKNDYSECFNENGLLGARIGVIRDFMGFHSEVDKVMEEAFDAMKKMGAELIDVKCAKDRDAWGKAEWQVLLYELKADMRKYLSERPSAPVQSLSDIIEYDKNHKETEMPWFDQEIFLDAEKKGDLNEPEYLNALKTSKALTKKVIDTTIDDNKLMALITPTNSPAWTIDLVNGDHYIGGTSDLAAISGYPSITVPAGNVHGLPVGLSFIGKAWQEAGLITLAYAFEQGTKKRFKPGFGKVT